MWVIASCAILSIHLQQNINCNFSKDTVNYNLHDNYLFVQLHDDSFMSPLIEINIKDSTNSLCTDQLRIRCSQKEFKLGETGGTISVWGNKRNQKRILCISLAFYLYMTRQKQQRDSHRSFVGPVFVGRANHRGPFFIKQYEVENISMLAS